MMPNRKAVVEMTIGLLVMAGSVQADPTVITACPVVINSPGRYLLAADLICGGGNGITIISSDVTLALEGHRITAGVGANWAITNFTIVDSVATPTPVERVRILGPGLITNGGGTFGLGFFFQFANNSEVTGVTVLGASVSGIAFVTSDFLTITANTLGRNGNRGTNMGGIVLVDVHSSTISGNDASGNNAFGMSATATSPGPLGTVSHNIFNGNASDGLFLVLNFNGATIQQNVSNGNGGNGIELGRVQGPIEVTNNTSLANGGSDLIDQTPGCSPNVWSGNTFFTANQSCIH
jgi:parallel beta-helix repeat protein